MHAHAQQHHRPQEEWQEQEPREEEEQGGVLRDRLEQLRRHKEMLELQETLREEMEDIIKDYELEELALHLATDTLGRILRPLREQPTVSPIDDCSTRSWPVQLEFGVAGTIVYTVCSYGDDASLRMRFQLPGQTTPAVDVTTPMDTSPLPLCAPVPTALSLDPATTASAQGGTDDSTTAS